MLGWMLGRSIIGIKGISKLKKTNIIIMKKLLILITHTIIVLSSCSKTESRKAAFMAGYYESSIIDYKFEMYPDSTFFLRRGLGKDKGIWQQEKDTFLLFIQDTLEMKLIAKITNSKAEVYVNEFRILKEMNLKTFSPPIIVQYPKPR